jgi:hypothetical protein
MKLSAMIFIGVSLMLGGCQFLPGTASYVERQAREAVQKEMLDPSSAIFDDVEARENNTQVCGRVNGRNSFGGMTGFQAFRYYVGSDKAYIANPGDPIAMGMAKC